MATAKKRKDTDFQTSMDKSVFLYGQPNVEKMRLLMQIQKQYTDLTNQYIEHIAGSNDHVLAIVKNDKKDSCLRALEKSLRPKGYNSAFSQNAFDDAVTKLSNRINNIRTDMYHEHPTIFTQSKILFAYAIAGETKAEMIAVMESVAASIKARAAERQAKQGKQLSPDKKPSKDEQFYLDCAEFLRKMSSDDFEFEMTLFHDSYFMTSCEYRIPHVKKASVSLDSRCMVIEESTDTTCSHIIAITNPTVKKQRIVVPINTSKNSLRRLKQYKAAGTLSYTIRGNQIKVTWSFEKKARKPAIQEVVGVDTGIIDCFHTSDNKVYGSFNDVIDFYKGTVEPAFAELSNLRNKKQSIGHYLHTHKDLPKDVRRSLIAKIDRLEHMIREAKAPYRKNRHYNQMLEHEIAAAVKTYINSIDRSTLTVLERLDIKEFDKSRKINGKLSMFARGSLQKKLMEKLNWHGYDFLEVEPAYTSQVCPECSFLSKSNRDGKDFTCQCCGYHDDADHVGGINIRARAMDDKLMDICNRNRYNHTALTTELREFYAERHNKYLEAHPKTTTNESVEAA